MEQQKEVPTGYPSVDKPWQKYYNSSALCSPLPTGSIYEYLLTCSRDFQNDVAMVYFGKRISYKTIFIMINKYARLFSSSGIKKGTIVPVISLGTPETICAIYALNKIGAIASMENIAVSPDLLGQSIARFQANTVIILDLFYPKYEKVLKAHNVNQILCLSISDSMPPIPKIIYRVKQGQISGQGLSIKGSSVSSSLDIDSVKVTAEDPAIIVQTSGTTSTPKKVVLSNLNINCVIHQYQNSNIPLPRGEKFLSIVPPFLAVGLTLQFHLPLCAGITSYICLDPAPHTVTKLLVKYKPNHFMGGASHLKDIISNPITANMDLPFLTNISVGGESLSCDTIKEINSFLQIHKSPAQLKTGYGMTELSSSVITEQDGIFKYESVGIPLNKVNVKIIDIDTGQELSYNEQGEILVSSPSLMLGYYGEKEKTDQIMDTDLNGTRWIHTGDIGIVDKDGFVFVTGRLKRIFQVLSPENNQINKLFPDHVEAVIEQYSGVRECAVVVVKNVISLHTPIAFIVSDCEINVDSLSAHLTRSLSPYELPSRYIFIDELPYLPNGKIDYRRLEEMIA